MKKLIVLIGILVSFQSFGQILDVTEGESGQSVANKLNLVFDYVNDSIIVQNDSLTTFVTPTQLSDSLNNVTTTETDPVYTADPAFSITSGDITNLGNLSGTNTGDQTITLTGNVTGSGTGSFTATIAAGAVDSDELASTAVSAGSYTMADIIVDADGRLTAASSSVYQLNTVQNGSKTASFTHDAESGDIGAYALSTTNAVTVSIHNLASGMQGTIFLNVTDVPSSLTVNTYSDAGTTGLTEAVLGSTATLATGNSTSITYTCANDGTNTNVYLVYGQE